MAMSDSYKTLYDISNGPQWVMWIFWILLVCMTIAFWREKGGFLIAGYNMMSEDEKKKYDSKRLFRCMAIGFSIIDAALLIMLLGEKVFPAWSIQIFAAVVLADIVGMIVVGNRKQKR